MPIPAIRTKQTTNTTGTGTLTLNAATAEFRSFFTAYGGSSRQVRYALSRAGVYEVGYGTFNGGSPGTLTRSTVIASSAGGALVSLAAGTTDVFFDFLPGDRTRRVVSSTSTLDLTDIGNLISCQQTADITVNLPAISTVPEGASYLIKNDGTNFSIVSIDPNGSDLLEGVSNAFPLFNGEAIEVFSTGVAWRSGARPAGWRLVSRANAASSTSVDFVIPAYISTQRTQVRYEFRNVRLATDGAFLTLRVDDAGGASFDAGATDYSHSGMYVSGAAAVAGAASTGDSSIRLTTDTDTTATANTISGTLDFVPGDVLIRFPVARFTTFTAGNGGIYAGPQIWTGGGARLLAMDANAVRFIASAGNINAGQFTQFVMYD